MEKKLIINTLNPHSYIVAKNDNLFAGALIFEYPGWKRYCFGGRDNKGVAISKIAGADLHIQLLSNANKNNGSVFYLGSTEETLELIKRRVGKDFPCKLEGGCHSHHSRIHYLKKTMRS